MDGIEKKNFLEEYLAMQQKLGKRQREYKKILATKLKTHKETIIEDRYQRAIEQLKLERNDVRAQIWVANGLNHVRDNKRYLSKIKCHVQCQEHLSDDIEKLKEAISNMEHESRRVDKQIYDLNRKIVPENQHQAHVAKARKKLANLENRLEVGMRRESGFAASNVELREELIKMLNHRTHFNDTYTKLVEELNSEKKYLVELIEYALGIFDSCIDIYEKIDNNLKRDSRDKDLRKVEMQGVMLKIAAESDVNEFMDTKAKNRSLADLQPKEYKRREKFRHKHLNKISLYHKVLEKIQAYTQTQSVGKLVEKFHQQESLYYSYFNYANELSYHMTRLTNSVDRLGNDIGLLKQTNLNSLQAQQDNIAKLEETLLEKQQKNEELDQVREASDQRLEQLLHGIRLFFKMSQCDATPLMSLLGNQSQVDLANVRGFLKILERRVFDITASVYVMERRTDSRPFGSYVVKEIDKFMEWPTDLNDIVLTQQCPECAEGEAINMEDAGDGEIAVQTPKETKKQIYENITQPEMQYRLHNISQCRLPRSRILAAKRIG